MKFTQRPKFVLVVFLLLHAGTALAQYKVEDPKYVCLSKDSETYPHHVVVGRAIWTPDGKVLCDFGFAGGDNVPLAPLSEFIAALANKALALEARVKALEDANGKLASDLEAWKKKTLSDSLQSINTLQFATQPSIVQALSPSVGDVLQGSQPFIDAIAKRVKASGAVQ